MGLHSKNRALVFVFLLGLFGVLRHGYATILDECSTHLEAIASIHARRTIHEPTQVDRNYRMAHVAALTAHNWGRPVRFVRFLAAGGESSVFEVGFEDNTSVAVRLPRNDHDRRARRNFASEFVAFRRASEADPEAAKYLAPFDNFFHLNYRGVRIPALSMAVGDTTLGSKLSELGPKLAAQEPEKFLTLFKQMALAIRALHAIRPKSQIHRDVKPDNFLVKEVNGEWQIWLIDLGVSAAQGEMPHNLEYHLSGTPSHMSPNQLGRGTAHPSDDLYGLIVSYYEMVSGQSIWKMKGQTNISLININEYGTYPVLRGFNPTTMAAIDPALQRVLNGDYQTAAQLVEAIDAEIADVRRRRLPPAP